jgi:hypothetical protein
MVNDPTWRRKTGRIPVEKAMLHPSDAATALSYDAGISLTLAARIVTLEGAFHECLELFGSLSIKIAEQNAEIVELQKSVAVLRTTVHTLDGCHSVRTKS